MSVVKMAWRNVWRNKRRSLVTVTAMTLALWVMILYSGLVEGYLSGMERKIVEVELGDLQIHENGFLDNPTIYDRVGNEDQIVEQLREKGFLASGRLHGAGLAAAGENSAGVILKGVDPATIDGVSKVGEYVGRGNWIRGDDPSGVVIGRRLAKVLEIDVGGEIVLLSQAADGSMANDLYRVVGVLRGMSEGVDRGGLFMTNDAFRELMVVPSGVHEIVVRKPKKLTLDEAKAQVLGVAEGTDVKTWRELAPMLASMMDSSRGMIYMMFLIVYISIGVVILNAMLMAVFERIREFGVLKAIGVGPGAVLNLVFGESAIMTGISIFFALLLSVPGLWYLTTVGLEMGAVTLEGVALDSIWLAEVSKNTFIAPIFIFVFIIFFAVLYPAVKAAVLKPVAAINHR